MTDMKYWVMQVRDQDGKIEAITTSDPDITTNGLAEIGKAVIACAEAGTPGARAIAGCACEGSCPQCDPGPFTREIPVIGSTRPATVSDDDYELVSRFRWYFRDGYAVCPDLSPDSSMAYAVEMSQLVLAAHWSDDPDNPRKTIQRDSEGNRI
jgi:hypothetical protein